MSTLNVANISDDQSTLTGDSNNPIDRLHFNKTVDTKFVTNGCAKAWAYFDGRINTSLRNSLNISSLMDHNIGDYELTVTSSFSTSNASASAGQFDDGGGETPTYVRTASAIIVQMFSRDDALLDGQFISSTAHGDLA